MFAESDIDLLNRLLKDFSSVVTTSYVLAEVSNLANKLSGSLRTEWYSALAKYAVVTDEIHVPSKTVGLLPEVARFGITDAALRNLAEFYTVITLEYRLSGYLQSLGLKVVNFNHLRSGVYK
jgi:hypothetical protein